MKSVQSLILAFVVILLFSCANKKDSTTTSPTTVSQAQTKKILVFTKTLGWRHQSIETGVATFRAFGKAHNFVIEHSEDSTLFSRKHLPQYDAIVFLNTTGNILDENGQKAFETYIKGGGSFLGVHAAADTEHNWPWYGKMVGGYFKNHPNNPNIREATLERTTHSHTSVSHLERSFSRKDEWYNYKNLNPDITPVLMLNEDSYEGGENHSFHPIAWYHNFQGCKIFYTGGGHTKSAYTEKGFRTHLERAILWCLE